jgi:hypothetical protein
VIGRAARMDIEELTNYSFNVEIQVVFHVIDQAGKSITCTPGSHDPALHVHMPECRGGW